MACGVILAHPRCGSSDVARALRKAGGYVSLEPFQRTMRKQGIKIGSEQFVDYKDEVLSRYAVIKHLWNSRDLTHAILDDLRSTPVLLLERKDAFAAALSATVAAVTRNFGRERPDKLDKPIPVTQLRERLQALTEGQLYWRDWLENSGRPYWHITYEHIYSSDSIEEAESKIADLCDFFGLPKNNLEAGAQMIMPHRKYSSFEFYMTAPNWSEVASAFHLSDAQPSP